MYLSSYSLIDGLDSFGMLYQGKHYDDLLVIHIGSMLSTLTQMQVYSLVEVTMLLSASGIASNIPFADDS